MPDGWPGTAERRPRCMLLWMHPLRLCGAGSPVSRGHNARLLSAPWVLPWHDDTAPSVQCATGFGRTRVQSQWTNAGSGTSPLVANGILYVARGNLIQALDPAHGTV